LLQQLFGGQVELILVGVDVGGLADEETDGGVLSGSFISRW